MTLRNDIENGLKNIETALNAKPIELEIADIKTNFAVSQTVVYKTQGAIENGFKQLASTVTDVVDGIEGSIPKEINKQIGVVKLDVSAAKKDLKKVVDNASKTDLTAIVGSATAVADGFLDVVISAPFPKAIGTVLKNTTKLAKNQIATIVKSNTFKNIGDALNELDNVVDNIVGDIFPNLNSAASLLKRTVSQISLNANSLLDIANKGFGSLIENAIEISLQPAYKLLRTVTIKSLNKEDFEKIISLVDKQQFVAAAKILSKYSNKSITELVDVVSKINNKASKQVSESKVPTNVSVTKTSDFIGVWKEATTDINSKTFSSIGDSEVTSEVINMKRDVTEIIVMFLGRPGATIQDYQKIYAENYNIGFNAHFYVGRDSIVYRGRPLEVEASSLPSSITNNHNQKSILIAVNINEDSQYNKVLPLQHMKLLKLIEQILIAKPGLQVYSAKDVGWNYTADQDALDIALVVKRKLGKYNLSNYDPKTEDPLTTEQLNNRGLDLSPL